MTATKSKSESVDMTQGNIIRHIVTFAFPLMLGNLFQQLYNMVDTWVIGQTGDPGAYAAVGSIGPITNILIGSFLGLASGAGVVISQHFGARREDRVKEAVHTSVALTLILGVAFTVLGLIATPGLLSIMLHSQSDADAVYPHAYTYLTVYFSGIMALMIYNMGSGILRAIGDSRHPFYFLVVSALTNIALDFLFVFGFRWGVFGVAFATVISEVVSAVCTVVTLLRSKTIVRVIPRNVKISKDELRRILTNGIPAALQMALTAFSNVFVQSYISGVTIGKTAALGGWTTYSKIDQMFFLPVQSIALAVTTFVGQNLGIGNVERAKKGTRVAFVCAVVSVAVLMAPVLLFAEPIAALFNRDPEILAAATVLLRSITPFYFCTCINQTFAAALRGAGNARAPMYAMLGAFVGFRQIYLFIMSNYISNDLLPIAMGYPVGWMVCSIAMLLLYRFSRFDKYRITETREEENAAVSA